MSSTCRLRAWIAGAAGLVYCLVAASGCSDLTQQREWGKCTVAGAIIGAAATAVGGVELANNTGSGDRSNERVAYGLGGAAIGAIVGGLAGHFICDPIVQPPPPPAPPPPPVVEAPPPPPPPVKEKIVLRGVHFDFNKANIRPDAVPILDEAVQILQAHPDVKINVNGYCDAIGSVPYNLKLSQRRADSVANYLQSKGIGADRLSTHGYGKTDFVAPNDTAEGRAQNRRVELVPQ